MTSKIEHTSMGETEELASSPANPTSESLARLVDAIKEHTDTEGLLHPALETIARYDRENQSDFLTTLKVYLQYDCNAQKCGRLLFLHRNSLVYRIRRIQEIGPCNLSDPEERSYLRLSLLLMD